ncbi:MAG: uroporphyrinogen decarboxylase [Bacteriovoracaceae bacterium]|jgi:uroporphyrinogen decarboxylase|nr:uroporphyrinogen decarboxylase [Bacteriovoracaceae bacterium]
MGLFTDRTIKDGKTGLPIWFMRQAGRYHAHYQNIRKSSDFMTMCKTPDLATEITMGPINEFDFDAAILFSDLLFPLEQLGLGLSYHTGPPTLTVKLDTLDKVNGLKKTEEATPFYQFQGDALTKIRAELPNNKTLLGFVGAPFTLYSYAVEGSHTGNLTPSKLGFYDGRFEAFMEKLLPELITNMKIQAKAGADAICLFDTAVGECGFQDFINYPIKYLKIVTKEFKKDFPNTRLVYYSKLTHMNYLQAIEDENIDVLGIDWRHDLNNALNILGKDYYVQGNLDPSHLFLPWNILRTKWDELFSSIENNVNISKSILGLGHGVLQFTPQENVKNSIQHVHDNFLY